MPDSRLWHIKPSTPIDWRSISHPVKRTIETVAEHARAARVGGEAAAFSVLVVGIDGQDRMAAAKACAAGLHVELYHIDLGAMLGKYIGNTQKLLDQLFSDAERTEAVLFFDEADALFGKRSKIEDAHDRYANFEVGYLLRKTETHRGLIVWGASASPSRTHVTHPRLDAVLSLPRRRKRHRFQKQPRPGQRRAR